MENTKHDLSYGIARLDFQALLRTAEIAYSQCKWELERKIQELQNLDFSSDGMEGIKRNFCTTEIKRIGKNITVASETLYVLREAQYRQEVEISNREENMITQSTYR